MLRADFEDLFKPELGCLKGIELDIKFKAEVKPIFCKARTVVLLDKLIKTYDAGIKKGLQIPAI